MPERTIGGRQGLEPLYCIRGGALVDLERTDAQRGQILQHWTSRPIGSDRAIGCDGGRGIGVSDLGGAETNSEMAIEMLPEGRRTRVVVCNAPVVEGAVMAATEAASGASLDAVRRTAEELTPV